MNKAERDKQIATSTAKAAEVAEQFGVSRSTVYRLRREYKPDPPAQTDQFAQQRMNRQLLFGSVGDSGLTRYGGQIEEEYQRELRADGGINLYTQMANHPVVAAVLFAVQMAQRQVEWFVEPVSDEANDKAAAEFLEQCMDDMAQTWDDVISQVFTMLKYGFSIGEIIYKLRLGQNPRKYTDDPARSRYSDGRIGWRRFQFINPRSLAMSDRWIFDEFNRVQGVRQQTAPTYDYVTIPMEKALLFRTSVQWDNPEGLSLLRPMYTSWYFAENLTEIEAIAAERMGTGIPVIYLGNGLDTSDNANSDWSLAKDITRNVRTDEQMGLVFPYPKMGHAPEGTGILFELMSPPSRGLIDFTELIDRHEKRMAMTALSQFIFLGMTQVGTQALNQSSTDTFQMSIAAWSDSVADVFNRFAVPRLFALNPFMLENLPKVAHSEIGVPDLLALAEYINKLVGATVLTPDGQLEDYIRQLAKLPEQADAVEVEPRAQPETTDDEGERQMEQQQRDAEAEVEASADFFRVIDEEFALRLRRGGPKWERATNAYEMELRRSYQGWADDTARELSEIDDERMFHERLEERIEELIALLILLGRRKLPQAHALGLGDASATPAGWQDIGGAIGSNDGYLQDSLGPAILNKVRARIADDPLIATDPAALGALLGTFIARVGTYAGAFWTLVARGFIDMVRQNWKTKPVRWVLEPRAKHCRDCPRYAGTYENYEMMLAQTGGALPSHNVECDGNCRCSLEVEVRPGEWVRRSR